MNYCEEQEIEDLELSENVEKLEKAFKQAKTGDFLELEDCLNDLGVDYNFDDGYSGRGMFGKVSLVAFTSSIRPRSKTGQILLQVFTCDNMGLDYIYYTKAGRKPNEDEEE